MLRFNTSYRERGRGLLIWTTLCKQMSKLTQEERHGLKDSIRQQARDHLHCKHGFAANK